MLEHTKGKWIASHRMVENDGGIIGYVKADHSDYHDKIEICVAYQCGKLESEILANVQLISAAPEMKEALQRAQTAIDTLFVKLIEKDNQFFPSQSGLPWEALLEINAAIQKTQVPL